ncbi:MAG TPA: NAD(P)H-binding protein [Rubrobacteraceae bacterium]|nr:NAD(P)H-binding protein [Rubrobacteraceae bacterium]
MSPSEVLVTGGRGALGNRVVDCLRAASCKVRALSRSKKPGTVRGDLFTGAGLDEAVRGVDTIVHCASNPFRKTRQTEVGGIESWIRAAARAGVSHLVYVSIVSVDRNPHYSYYRAKLEAKRVVERSGVPWTIRRATQFHDFVLKGLNKLEVGPVVAVPKDFLFQPVDMGEVAGRLAELVLSESARYVPDFGGPEVRTAAELAHNYLEVAGRRKRTLELPLSGKFAHTFGEGTQTCPDGMRGRVIWEEFLGERRDAATGRVSSAYDRTD